MAQNFIHKETELTIADSGTSTGSFQKEKWCMFMGVHVESDLTDQNLTIEVSRDDSTFVPIIDVADGEDFLVLASGADPAYIDISDVVRTVPYDYYIRLTAAGAQTGAKTIYVHQVG